MSSMIPNVAMFALRAKSNGMWVKALTTVGNLDVSEWTDDRDQAARFTPVDSVKIMDELNALHDYRVGRGGLLVKKE